jgi:hypothetical protein
MTVIPNFILRRLYQKGTLRRLPEGVGFDIINNLGPGEISRLNGITLNGTLYPVEKIMLHINGTAIQGILITEKNPATFFLNQKITCIIQEIDIPAGQYEISLDLVSREAGKVVLTVQDQLA